MTTPNSNHDSTVAPDLLGASSVGSAQSGSAPNGFVRQALGQWWHSGGALWAIALGFMSVFALLPGVRLVALGLGDFGALGWQGVQSLWPYPAFLTWSDQVAAWSGAFVAGGTFIAEGWIISGVLIGLFCGLARVPLTLVWRNNRRPVDLIQRLEWPLFVMVASVGLLGLGAVFAAAQQLPTGPFVLALVGIAGILILGLAATLRAMMWQVSSWPRLWVGIVVGTSLPIAVLAFGYQVVWLGWFAGLPLVQLAVLTAVFGLCWAGHHLGVYIAASDGNADALSQRFIGATPGSRAALALEALRVMDRRSNLHSGASLDDIAAELTVRHAEIASTFAKLADQGIVFLDLDKNGQARAQWAQETSALSIHHVVQAFEAGIGQISALGAGAADNCLIYAAKVESEALDVTLIDLFHHRENARVDQQRLGAKPSLVAFCGHDVNASQMTRMAQPVKAASTSTQAQAQASSLLGHEDAYARFDPIDFENPFWDDLALDALQGLEEASSRAEEKVATLSTQGTPTQLQRFSNAS